ncbi:MAG: cob(I)yrinic acid a,c-diamide adenosyltransferase [Prolixibacteraceae bacterium]
MEKKKKIYTKTGDDGTTELLGGTRVKKHNNRLEAYGTVDELNANIGLILSVDISLNIQKVLIKIQHKLFNIGSRLASDEKSKAFTAELAITNEDVELLEVTIDRWEEDLPGLNHFILPGGIPAAAQCQVARAVCRRAERRILEFSEDNEIQPEIIYYMNRLSDLLFVLARKLNFDDGVDELIWKQE